MYIYTSMFSRRQRHEVMGRICLKGDVLGGDPHLALPALLDLWDPCRYDSAPPPRASASFPDSSRPLGRSAIGETGMGLDGVHRMSCG